MTTCHYRPPLLCRFFLVSYHITRVSMRSNLLLFAILPLPATVKREELLVELFESGQQGGRDVCGRQVVVPDV